MIYPYVNLVNFHEKGGSKMKKKIMKLVKIQGCHFARKSQAKQSKAKLGFGVF